MSDSNSSDLRKVRLTSVTDLPSDFKIKTDLNRWNPWKRIPILNRYIFLEIIGPFLISLSFFTFIYMVMALQKMIGLFVGKGVDFFRLLDYLGYLLGNTLPSTIPMACLMGGIMAAGRLSGDSEITAMRSAGISFTRIYSNFVIFGFLMAFSVGYLNFYVGPENARKMNEFNNWIVAYNPLLAVKPGQFTGDEVKDNFEARGRTLYTEDADPDTGEMFNIQIREWELFEGGNDFLRHNNMIIPMGGSRMTQIIAAQNGRLVEKVTPEGNIEKSIRLKKGFIIEWNEKKDGLMITNFLDGEMDYQSPSDKQQKVMSLNVKPETFSFPDLILVRNNIESNGFEDVPGLEMLKEFGISIKGVKGFQSLIEEQKIAIATGMADGSLSPEELNMRYSLLTQLLSLYKDSQRILTQFNVEIHKRIAAPVSCQIFFFLSFPLGLVVRRSGKGMSFSLAIIFLFLYYGIFIMGTGLSFKPNVPDWIGPWLANFTMAVISIYIMISRTDIQVKHSMVGKFYFQMKKFFSPYFQKLIAPIRKVSTPVSLFLIKLISPLSAFLKKKWKNIRKKNNS
ncbi:MAG: LptF/LptG family permease [Leptospiraceae bacterium]|nr:LptF/LptG family permease [Leptospiraceae bacterium]MCP5511249.1 LptF/LptG family permease [Leptospiraceae bacterium]